MNNLVITRRNLLSIVPGIAGLALARERHALTPQVLAVYYGWYANPDLTERWSHWPDGTAHEPEIERYDSHDTKTIQQQINHAKSAGITGFIVSWWRPGDFQDQGMPLVLDAASRAGLKVTACVS